MYTETAMQVLISALMPIDPDTPSEISVWVGEGTTPRSNWDRASKQKERNTRTTRNRVLLFSGMWELALYRAEVLRSHGFEVLTARNKQEAIQLLKLGDLDVLVLTYTLPNETVHEVADLLRAHCPRCALVTISESARNDRRIAPDATVIADEGPSAAPW